MKYKVGDRVRIKSLDWYNENKDEYGYIDCGSRAFFTKMSDWCGKIVTIKEICKTNCYHLEEYDFDWTDEMIEGFAEEEYIIDIDEFQDDNEIIDIIDEYVHRLKDNECQINLPEGYQFTDENGNEILTSKIILEKKKKEYPKTYEECLSVLGIYNGLQDVEIYNAKPSECTLFESLIRLKRCRDAYWKIAGEEMRLGKPWKPDWKNHNIKYVLFNQEGEIDSLNTSGPRNYILAFPTPEMRDAFYENFKEEIEICKELL